MKHATSRMLFAYWDGARGERAAPERSEIQPASLRHVLADTFLLDVDRVRGATYRLAGTRCSALFGRELKGSAFRQAWPEPRRTEAERLVATVTGDTLGLVVGLLGTNAEGALLPLEMLLLPLRHRGRTDARLLGSLAPATLPSWAGLIPLAAFETTSIRVIQTVSRPWGAPPPEAIERRRRFVVHEGGRG